VSSSNEIVRPINKTRYYSIAQLCDIIINATYKWGNKYIDFKQFVQDLTLSEWPSWKEHAKLSAANLLL